MSDRVTWEKCPKCGAPAAVGWTTGARAADEPVDDEPTEIDCTSGCELSADEWRQTSDR
jgi:DNA-directed RNA polymerase subunit M/transcription elongation factor TFIIS